MAVRVEKAADAQKEAFEGLREQYRESGTIEWFYDEKTVCLLTEGRAVIEHYGERTPVEAGDLVTFPQGIRCRWEILEPMRVRSKPL